MITVSNLDIADKPERFANSIEQLGKGAEGPASLSTCRFISISSSVSEGIFSCLNTEMLKACRHCCDRLFHQLKFVKYFSNLVNLLLCVRFLSTDEKQTPNLVSSTFCVTIRINKICLLFLCFYWSNLNTCRRNILKFWIIFCYSNCFVNVVCSNVIIPNLYFFGWVNGNTCPAVCRLCDNKTFTSYWLSCY